LQAARAEAKLLATHAERRADQAEQRAVQGQQQAVQAHHRAARLAEFSRKARRGQASAEELQELDRLEESSGGEPSL
jgi:hypothetical protein